MDPNLTIEEFWHHGLFIRIGWDDCVHPDTNPRTCDGNFGTIVMRELRDIEGTLGEGDEMWDESNVTCERCEGNGEARDRESPTGYSECPECVMGEVTIDHLEHARREGARAAIGIYYVAHGPQHGVRTNALNLIDSDLGRADGVIFDTPNTIRANGWEHRPLADVCAALESELTYWNAYLEGHVYVYEIEDANGVLLDSLSGMLDLDEEYAMREARAAAEEYAKDPKVARLPKNSPTDIT